MERLNIIWKFVQALVTRVVRQKKRVCIAAAAGTAAVVLTGVGVLAVHHATGTRQSQTADSGGAGNGQEEDQGDDDPDPDGQVPLGMEGVIEGVLSTRGLTRDYRAMGTSCEVVLVGQRKITREVVSRLDVGQELVQTVNQLDNQSWSLASATSMTDNDYENLLAVVEAEAGGEDVEGRIMVANVILNRVEDENFPEDVTSVIWQKAGGSSQFSPTEDGRIHSVTISNTTREAVNRAIDGEDLSQGALYFIAKNQADTDNIAWFDETLTHLFDHGGHSFYK